MPRFEKTGRAMLRVADWDIGKIDLSIRRERERDNRTELFSSRTDKQKALASNRGALAVIGP
jgi:hypothetical protein